jgi:cell division septation protein DedD
VVQLSAQKSEAEAQAAFRTAQTKYSVLNGRQPLIRRKDTDRGVFYAAHVGPFSAKGDADQLCDSLKSVGGNCWVYRN